MFCLDVFPLFVYLCGMERLHPDTTPEHKAALLLPYVSSHCVCSLALCISTLTFGQLRHRIVRLSSGVHTPSPGPSPPPAIKTTHISAPFSHLLCLGLWQGALYGMILTWTIIEHVIYSGWVHIYPLRSMHTCRAFISILEWLSLINVAGSLTTPP